jgi:phosphoribosylformylglycinamidine cyclo-ligase
MPGMYHRGEYDLAGCVVGLVERARLIDGTRIRPGDVILGLPSNGLHTNGYSLARKIFFEQLRLNTSARIDGLRLSLGEELLRTHQNYQPLLAQAPAGKLKGLAHITGGGLLDNLPRILPNDCDAVIETSSWKVPAIFRVLEERGGVARAEMYRVFNMGIGLAAVIAPNDAPELAKKLRARIIGRIESGHGVTELR